MIGLKMSVWISLFNVLPHRSPKKTTHHPWSRQHHCCSGNWGLYALHCQRLPCSHGALVQRRLPNDQQFSLVQPPQQWTAAHNHVWHLFFLSFISNCNDKPCDPKCGLSRHKKMDGWMDDKPTLISLWKNPITPIAHTLCLLLCFQECHQRGWRLVSLRSIQPERFSQVSSSLSSFSW